MARPKKKYHYIYKTTCILSNRYYIGMHSTSNLEDGYMGSGKRLRYSIRKHGIENHTKEILEFLEDRESLAKREAEIVNEELINDPFCMNITMGGEGFNSLSMASVKDVNGNKFKVLINDPRYLSGELVGVTKGTTLVKNSEGLISRISIEDRRYLDKELVHVSKGLVTVKDVNGKTFSTHTNDPRFLTGEIIGIFTGKQHKEESKRLIGEKNSIKQKGSGNSQFGTCWITNEVENKKIKKGDLIPDGWRLGRKILRIGSA